MDLVELINYAIYSRTKEPPRKYIGASTIGRACDRAIWYGFNDEPGGETPSTLQRIFDVGHQLEGLLLDYVELTGLHVERPSEKNNMLFVRDSEVPILQGHMDGVLHIDEAAHVVLELKTANNNSFQKFQKNGFRAWSESYYAQVQAYMGMSGLSQAVVLAINKDNAELHHQWVQFDSCHYELLRRRARNISEAAMPPDRINRSPLYVVCKRCQFKEVCHGN